MNDFVVAECMIRQLHSHYVDAVWRQAREAGVIDDADHALIEARNRLRDKVIRVDDFAFDFGRGAP